MTSRTNRFARRTCGRLRKYHVNGVGHQTIFQTLSGCGVVFCLAILVVGPENLSESFEPEKKTEAMSLGLESLEASISHSEGLRECGFTAFLHFANPGRSVAKTRAYWFDTRCE